MASDGAAGFDFLLGSWKVHNRKLRDVADRACTEWIEFDPAAAEWSIWWSSTRTPGKLDVPVRGRFDGTAGVFECDDIGRGVVH
jgi:hypothetical protein